MMITEKEAQELLKEGKIKQLNSLYYYPNIENHTDVKTVMRLNGLEFAFSEWWEFYHDISLLIKEKTGENKIVPLITYETCVSCGL